MSDSVTTLDRLRGTQPPVWPHDLSEFISDAVAASPTKLVILDDDPTGTQTVHGIPVLTTWSVDVLEKELRASGPGFFILTNSRSLAPEAAQDLNRDLGINLRQAIAATGIAVQVISRSDSTLRGHYPGEMDALMQALKLSELPCILIPCFFEGGRYTVDDIHYVAEDGRLIPAAQTPYARDAAFGYRHSNLREWVIEKTDGRVTADRVTSVSLEDIRCGGPHAVRNRLLTLAPGECCIVNAIEYRDLEVFTAGLLDAEAQGKAFVFRSAASFVRVRAGIRPRDLLDRDTIAIEDGSRGGLFVVGSYVPKTSAQLSELLEEKNVVAIEVRVDDLLDPDRRRDAVSVTIAAADQALASGLDAVVYTSRDLVTGIDARSSLEISRQVSDSLIAIIQGIGFQPRYVVAKGGITSSDIATVGLKARRAIIIGQILPGVPVWRLGQETRWPGIAYVVFPGNVGNDQALVDVRRRLILDPVGTSNT
jgi:uncharacterized protein YgbK (DUF1537 family)